MEKEQNAHLHCYLESKRPCLGVCSRGAARKFSTWNQKCRPAHVLECSSFPAGMTPTSEKEPNCQQDAQLSRTYKNPRAQPKVKDLERCPKRLYDQEEVDVLMAQEHPSHSVSFSPTSSNSDYTNQSAGMDSRVGGPFHLACAPHPQLQIGFHIPRKKLQAVELSSQKSAASTQTEKGS